MSALLSWVCVLWFFLGFSTTGHLVVMIWTILRNDMPKFMALMSVFLFGFSLAFFVSTTTNEERCLSSFTAHMFDCFAMMTSGFDKADHQKSGSVVIVLV